MGSGHSKSTGGKKKGVRKDFIEKYDSFHMESKEDEESEGEKTKVVEEDVSTPYFRPKTEIDFSELFNKVKKENQKTLKEQLHPTTEYVKLGNDSRVLINQRTKSVRLYRGEIIDGIIINGVGIGGTGGSKSDVLILRTNEIINEIEAYFCNYYGHQVIGKLIIRTSQGRELKGGLAKQSITRTEKKIGMINFVGGMSWGGSYTYLNGLEFAVEPIPNYIQYEDNDAKERSSFLLEEDEVIQRTTIKLSNKDLDEIPSVILLGD